METIIECKNLTHYYGARCIYTNLNFSIPKGRILGLLGKNGTGKTTLINILMGFLKPHSGKCTIFNEPSHNLSAQTKQRIGLLLEGHLQYSFMNIEQLERFYAAFYPNWRREPFYELMSKLKIAPGQRVNRMSCGQRSQVALGLILAQNADLLILDDFSMGLDPGYRRLFIDYLNQYVKAEGKTMLLTSHIIQDLENLIDDCIVLDYGKILTQLPTTELLNNFKRYRFNTPQPIEALPNGAFFNTEKTKGNIETYSFFTHEEVKYIFSKNGIQSESLMVEKLSLEDAFIGLTGKY